MIPLPTPDAALWQMEVIMLYDLFAWLSDLVCTLADSQLNRENPRK